MINYAIQIIVLKTQETLENKFLVLFQIAVETIYLTH